MLEKYCAENWPGEQGASPLIVKGFAPDTWLSGLRTVTEAEPATAMSAAGMLAVSRPAFTKVVVRAAPFHSRSEERRVGKECRSRWSAEHERRRREVVEW